MTEKKKTDEKREIKRQTHHAATTSKARGGVHISTKLTDKKSHKRY
jgi:hypothetical protein